MNDARNTDSGRKIYLLQIVITKGKMNNSTMKVKIARHKKGFQLSKKISRFEKKVSDELQHARIRQLLHQ